MMKQVSEKHSVLQLIDGWAKNKQKGNYDAYVLKHDQYVTKLNRADAVENIKLYYFLLGLDEAYYHYVQDQHPKTSDEAKELGQQYSARLKRDAARRDDHDKTRTKKRKSNDDRERTNDDRRGVRAKTLEGFLKGKCRRCGNKSHETKDCYAGEKWVKTWTQLLSSKKIDIPKEVNNQPKKRADTPSAYSTSLSSSTRMKYVREMKHEISSFDEEIERKPEMHFMKARIMDMETNYCTESFVDSGCSFDAVSSQFAADTNMSVMHYKNRPLKIKVGGGKRIEVPRKVAEMTIEVENIGVYKANCFVLDHIPDGKDVLLGLPFLKITNPDINWTSGELRQRKGADQYEETLNYHRDVEFVGASGATKVISFDRMCRLVRTEKTKEAFWFQLKIETKAERQQNQGWEQLVDHPMYDVLLKYKDSVFNDDAPPTEQKIAEGIQHEIDLTNTAPISTRNYRLSKDQKNAVEEWIIEMLEAGLIKPSKSPFSSPIIVVKKPIGWRIVHDYRLLNSKTLIPQCSIPRREEIIDAMVGGHYFTAMDLRSGYYQIPLRESDQKFTAFNTGSGQYEYTVMAQGLAGAPSTFNKVMQSMFRDLQDISRAFFDDIFVFTSSKVVQDHIDAVERVLQRLKEKQMRVKLSKCVFMADEIPVLGDFVGRHGVRIDPEKLEVIRNWPIPRTRKQLKSFLGTLVFNMKFIKEYGKLIPPLHRATQGVLKNQQISLSSEQLDAFDKCKQAITSTPVLGIPDNNLPFGIRTDASDFGIGGSLFNILPDKTERVLAYYGRKLSNAELNYPVREKEFLAVLHALRIWRPYLLDKAFICETDHKSLEQLLTQPKCTRRMARWLDELAEYPVQLKWIPGATNSAADSLSRLPQFMNSDSPASVVDMRIFLTTLLDDPQSFAHHYVSNTLEHFYVQDISRLPSIQDLCQQHYRKDPYLCDILEMLEVSEEGQAVPAEPVTQIPKVQMKQQARKSVKLNRIPFVFESKLLWHVVAGRKRLCVPREPELLNRIMWEHHDVIASGHPGRDKTIYDIKQLFFWKNMDGTIAKYVKTCQSCQRTKARQEKPPGLLQPLEIPEERWRKITMDFLTGLPSDSQAYDMLWVITCRLSKRMFLIPAKKTDSAEDCAVRFFEQYLRFHDLPDSIVSDRDSKFKSVFWKTLMKLHGTKIELSSAFRPQTDGQTEILNRFIEDYLRIHIGTIGDSWSQRISIMERAFNTRVHSSHGKTPFEVDTGRRPRSVTSQYVDALTDRKEKNALKFKEKIDLDLLNAHENLAKAQMRMQKYYNINRREQTFNVGDKVLLGTKNLDLPHLLLKKDDSTKRKMAPRYIGPFEVVQRAASPDTYKINLPSQLTLHPEFHTSMLKPWFVDPDPSRRSDMPPMIDANGDAVYLVEKIVAKRKYRKQIQYKVRWLGYPPSEDTWEFQSNLRSVAGLVNAFEARTKSAPPVTKAD